MIGTGPDDGPFDAGTYGRSFADVYDTWYPMESETTEATSFLRSLCRPGLPVLEVGVGTGRLSIPLARAGQDVTGMDSSTEMLARLADKAAAEDIVVSTVLGDAADEQAWPRGPFGLVVAAYNFVFNLIGDDAKTAFFHNAARVLDHDGTLVLETFVPAEGPTATTPTGDPTSGRGRRSERHLELKEISFDSVILIASETDHSTGTVLGQHVELRDGEPVRLRPWRVHVMTPTALDDLAALAGLGPVERFDDWTRAPFGPDSHRAVSLYRRND